MRERRGDAGQQVKNEKFQVPELVLDIIAKRSTDKACCRTDAASRTCMNMAVKIVTAFASGLPENRAGMNDHSSMNIPAGKLDEEDQDIKAGCRRGHR